MFKKLSVPVLCFNLLFFFSFSCATAPSTVSGKKDQPDGDQQKIANAKKLSEEENKSDFSTKIVNKNPSPKSKKENIPEKKDISKQNKEELSLQENPAKKNAENPVVESLNPTSVSVHSVEENNTLDETKIIEEAEPSTEQKTKVKVLDPIIADQSKSVSEQGSINIVDSNKKGESANDFSAEPNQGIHSSKEKESSTTKALDQSNFKEEMKEQKNDNKLESFFGSEEILLPKKVVSTKIEKVGIKDSVDLESSDQISSGESPRIVGFSEQSVSEMKNGKEGVVVFSEQGRRINSDKLEKTQKSVVLRQGLAGERLVRSDLSEVKIVGLRDSAVLSELTHDKNDVRIVLTEGLKDEKKNSSVNPVVLPNPDQGRESDYGKVRSFLNRDNDSKKNSALISEDNFELSENFLRKDRGKNNEPVRDNENVQTRRFLKTLEWIESRGRSEARQTAE